MPERELSTTAYLTLGLLASRDWSAYQLAEQVGRGVEKLWPSADRQRYNTVKRLLERGLVEARAEATGKRTRTIYSITPEGRAALAAWLATESKPPSLEFEGMVRVLVSEQGTIEDLRATLAAMRDQADADRALFVRHAAFIDQTRGTFPERRHLFALANAYMVGHFDHRSRWATWALEQIESWPDVVSPAETHGDQVHAILSAIVSGAPLGGLPPEALAPSGDAVKPFTARE